MIALVHHNHSWYDAKLDNRNNYMLVAVQPEIRDMSVYNLNNMAEHGSDAVNTG